MVFKNSIKMITVHHLIILLTNHDDPLFSSNSGFINDVLKKCGGQNILDFYEPKKSMMLSLEFLINSNVDVIYSISE